MYATVRSHLTYTHEELLGSNFQSFSLGSFEILSYVMKGLDPTGGFRINGLPLLVQHLP